MIVDYQFIPQKNAFVVSYINAKGNIKYHEFKAPKSSWEICENNKNSKKLNWDGRAVAKCDLKWMSKFDIYEFMYNLSDENEIFKMNLPNITSIDIEVETLDSMPKFQDFVNQAEGRVLTIAFTSGNNVCVFGLKEISSDDISSIQNKIKHYLRSQEKSYNFKYVKFDSEQKMLQTFMREIIPRISLQTGWNYEKFDWTYLMNRCQKYGIIPKTVYPETKMKTDIYPYHVLVLDLADIFKRFDRSVSVKENNTLDWVSANVLGVKKVPYDGSLNQLYNKDYNLYVFYNAIDAALVELLNKKLQLLEMICLISYMAKIPIVKAPYPSHVAESLVANSYYDDNKVVVYEKSDGIEPEGYEGAYVKDLEPGFYSDVMCADASSMYPSIMRGFNISPLSYVGKFEKEEVDIYNERGYITTKTGVVYEKTKTPMNKRLTDLYNTRLSYKSENKEIFKIIQDLSKNS